MPLQASSTGGLFFVYQRQKYEVVPPDDASHVAACRPVLCPTALPLGEYAAARGLGASAAARAHEEFGDNSFAIPMPTWGELYKEQLKSPIAVFQLLCSVLWMLDEYWK